MNLKIEPALTQGSRQLLQNEVGTSAFGHRILVVDDMAGIHDDIRKILCREESSQYNETHSALFGSEPDSGLHKQFEIDSAYQGKEGLDLVIKAVRERRRYALAFLDIRMPPGWDGIETASKLWEVDPHLQIIICSAHSDYSWNEIAKRLGHTDNLVFLKKPFENIEIQQLTYALTAKAMLSAQNRARIEKLDDLVARSTQELRVINAQLISDIAARKETEARLAVFADLGKRLGEAHNAKAAAEIIVEVADQLIGWDSCSFFSYCEEKNIFEPVVHQEVVDGRKQAPPFQTMNERIVDLARRSLKEGAQLLSMANGSDQTNDSIQLSIICVPLRNDNKAIGVLSIEGGSSTFYDRSHVSTLQALADHCAGVLSRIKSQEILQQTEQQLRHAQKMEAIGLLAGGVAHDFNNLLSVILNNAELALEDNQQGRISDPDTLKDIVKASTRASTLTAQLLSFSRRQLISPKPLNLNEVISNLSKMLNWVIGQDIQLQLNLAQCLPMIHADAGMLDQVLVNLVVNSRDAMPEGGEIKISTQAIEFSPDQLLARPEARPGRFVCLSVTDTGTGIPPEFLQRIFEPFFTTKERNKGTGLGLSITFGIVKQHKGWIEVTSTVGKGTTFQIFLPSDNSITPAPVLKNEMPPGGGTELIFMVEDRESVRRSNRRLLTDAGYRLIEASSGFEALDLWHQHAHEVDLLLTDVLMPGGMNGWELASRLTESKPELKVIFISGYAGDIPAQSLPGQNSSNFRYLQKPCVRDQLLRAIRECLDQNPGIGGISP